MRYLDEMQQGGYPFDDVSINYLQQMHDDRDSFIHSVFGDNRIVKGIQIDGTSSLYSDGLITVDGKMYHFVGGILNTKISKIKIETKRFYEDGVQKKAFINEFYQFGTAGTDVIDFADLKRYYASEAIKGEIKQISANLTNEDLPEGWFIADGTNGTDDLRSRFIVGKDTRNEQYKNVKLIGGSKQHTLTEAELPAHRHGMEDGGPGEAGEGLITAGNPGSGGNSLSGAFTKQTGGGQPHENRPPYFVLLIIQFVGI